MERTIFCGIDSERVSQWPFISILAALFAGSAVLTIAWCTSMSATGVMPMPGGWTLSMVWKPMCGQTWFGAAASFAGMWTVMMIAMMMPSLAPTLWRYQIAVTRTGGTGAAVLTGLMGAGYFFVWSAFGLAVFPLGVVLTMAEMRSPAPVHAVPAAVGVVILIAGALQFTSWKACHLACCRNAWIHCRKLPAGAGAAWRDGLRHGLHCGCCCAGLTASLLAVGIMDLRAMAIVTVAITAERIAPAGERAARAIGALAIGAGLFLIANAVCGTS